MLSRTSFQSITTFVEVHPDLTRNVCQFDIAENGYKEIYQYVKHELRIEASSNVNLGVSVGNLFLDTFVFINI